jgi:hypothetical protein
VLPAHRNRSLVTYTKYIEDACLIKRINIFRPWRRGLVASFLPTFEETGAMGREFESRQVIGW